jgi:hypothetical protein
LPSLDGNLTFAGPFHLGLRAIGHAGLRLIDGVEPGALQLYLDGLESLRRSEHVEVWVLAVVALIELATTARAEVCDAVGELRRELDRIGAAGAIEALDRALAAGTEATLEPADRSVESKAPKARPLG